LNEFDTTQKTILVPVGTRFPKNIHDELKIIAVREGRPLQDILIGLSNDYIKKHKEGNPTFTLDQYQDENFKAYPALAAPYNKRREWFYKFKQHATPKDVEEIRFLLQEWNELFKEQFKWL